MNKKEKKPIETEGFSNVAVPTDCMDMVNMYGTYNIQPTSEHAHEYPAIAQGLSHLEAEERRRARNEWKSAQSKKPQSGGHLEADPTKGDDGSLPRLLNDRK